MSELSIDHLGVAMNIINGRVLTDQLLSEVLTLLRTVDPTLNDEGIDRVRSRLESTIGIKVQVGEVMRGDMHKPWLQDEKSKITWEYWESYLRLLESQGWNMDVRRVLDQDTENILSECGNPAEVKSWSIRGLVMGDVQSGKTANYSGLIAKAADAGYRFIVLLTGMIEDLRKQTQERLDANFVGRASRDIFVRQRNMQAIGAGKYRQKSANVLTSVDFDFLAKNAQTVGGIPLNNLSEPILFVMKKNKAPLENLVKWLDAQSNSSSAEKHSFPLLIIDDEADNASVNVRKDGETPATINRLIREILTRFTRSSYVAYTATPFANVFIDPENSTDLFPSDFIYSLKTPSNYIGASNIFSEDGEYVTQLREIADADEAFPHKHRKDHSVEKIPNSLKDALRTFVLSCAIRDLRNEDLRHRSMLVNVTRFTDVQVRISEKLKDFLWILQQEVKQFLTSLTWSKHPELQLLEIIWEREYLDSGYSWDEVRMQLHDSIASIEVLTINQKAAADDKLNYSHYKDTAKGRRVIAVGGLTLSRGLTLEGLCVSYFYRNSKAYDTLLQMGRWFGYRTGYEDLFRVWMSEEAQNWYEHIADVVTELRMNFRRMSKDRLPPSQFGIRVKSHQDTLIVTALNKLRASKEIKFPISFSAFGTETPYIPRNQEVNKRNVSRVNQFLLQLPPAELQEGSTRYRWKKIDRLTIANFLEGLEISNMNLPFLPDYDTGKVPLFDFIRDNKYEMLNDWDISLPQGRGSDVVSDVVVPLNNGKNGTILCRQRQFESVPRGASYWKLNKQRVGDTSDEKVGLRLDEQKEAEREWEAELLKSNTKAKGKSVPGYMYRQFRKTPLLTIHFIQSVDPRDREKAASRNIMPASEIGTEPMVAISISFPDFDPALKDELVVYRLNSVALNALFGSMVEDDEDDDDD